MVRPKKYLGQHFLTDPAIAERIVDLLPAGNDQSVMEIGPGKGILTDILVRKNYRKLIPVEIDSESVSYLVRRHPALSETMIEADFLKMDERFFRTEILHIIGNFPYNISSQIFFRIIDQRQHVKSVVCMVQKEVAERIAAKPGSKTYGILSVLLQAYFDVKLHFHVKPGSFFPPPKVHSSVIRLTRNSVEKLDCDEKQFIRVVKATFNQRRKTIRNSLKTILLPLEDHRELLSKRPEQLGVEDFIRLTNMAVPVKGPTQH